MLDVSTIQDSVIRAIEETGVQPLQKDLRDQGLTGLSGLKTVGLLQRLAALFSQDPTACYLEIGVFQGLTLVNTALAAAPLPCYGIDNFATLDPESKNLSVVNERVEKFGTTNAHLINADFEEGLEGLETHVGDRRVAVYFVDGPHDYRSQLVCLLSGMRHLREGAVIVIDDANYPDVRWATRDFLVSHPEYKLVFEAYSPDHPANLSDAERPKWENEWLNGIHVIVHDPDNRLPVMMPTLSDDRTLHFNGWLVNRLRLAELAPEALVLADAITTGTEAQRSEAEATLRARHAERAADYAARQTDRNMYSADLPRERLSKPA